MGKMKPGAGSKVEVGLAAGWTVLLCSLPAVVCAASADDYRDASVIYENLGLWLVSVVISIAIISVWYWIGSRIFRCKPLFTNCLIAAIVIPIVSFCLQLVAGFFLGFVLCINIYLGLLALLLFLIYLLSLYVKWVNEILELESTGVALVLVLVPVAFNVVLSLALREY